MGYELTRCPARTIQPTCTDGTLTGQNHVFGDVIGSQALAVIIHASTIRGDASLRGGAAV